MKHFKVGVVFLVIAVFSCLSPNTSFAKIVDRVVAIVNDDCITLSELKEKAREILARTGQTNRGLDDDLLAQLLPQVIDQHLIQKEIEARGIKVTEHEVDLAIKDILDSNGMDLEQLKAILAKQGQDLQSYRAEIKRQIEHSRLISSEVRGKIVVTDEEIREYLKKHPPKNKGKGPIYVLDYIFIDAGQGENGVEGAKKLAETILDRLKHPQDNTEAETRFKELGSFALSEMAPFIRQSVEGLKKGDISGIVQAQNGFYIIRVRDILQPGEDILDAKMEETRRRIMREKLEARFQEWLQELRDKASIRILL